MDGWLFFVCLLRDASCFHILLPSAVVGVGSHFPFVSAADRFCAILLHPFQLHCIVCKTGGGVDQRHSAIVARLADVEQTTPLCRVSVIDLTLLLMGGGVPTTFFFPVMQCLLAAGTSDDRFILFVLAITGKLVYQGRWSTALGCSCHLAAFRAMSKSVALAQPSSSLTYWASRS